MRYFAISVLSLALPVSFGMAADLPVTAPAEYVQICGAFGEGFFVLPGTDTCLRVEGRVRTEFRWDNFGDEPNAWDRRTQNATTMRARAYARLDARTQTEYGLLRAYIDLFATVDTPSFSETTGTVVDRPSDDNQQGSFGPAGRTSLGLDYAFVQFGGLTAGKTQSFYDFFTGYAFGAVTATAYSDVKPWVAAYTLPLSQGISASLSFEDRAYRQQGLFVGPYLNLDPSSSQEYAGHRWPDVVGNLRFDGSWGSAQIMGALHHIRYLSSLPDGDLGFAVGGGVKLDLPFMGDARFALQSTYAHGALAYAHSDWGATVYDASAVFPTGGGSAPRRGNGTGEAWSVVGSLQKYWSGTFSTVFEASYAEADNTLYWDVQQTDVLATAIWTPVSNLEIGTEFGYRHLDFNNATAPGGPQPISRPRDQDIMTWMIRVQRDF